MPNSYPHDGFFNLHLNTIKNSYNQKAGTFNIDDKLEPQSQIDACSSNDRWDRPSNNVTYGVKIAYTSSSKITVLQWL